MTLAVWEALLYSSGGKTVPVHKLKQKTNNWDLEYNLLQVTELAGGRAGIWPGRVSQSGPFLKRAMPPLRTGVTRRATSDSCMWMQGDNRWSTSHSVCATLYRRYFNPMSHLNMCMREVSVWWALYAGEQHWGGAGPLWISEWMLSPSAHSFCYLAAATIMKYHELSSFNNRHHFPTALEAASLGSKCRQGWFLPRSLWEGSVPSLSPWLVGGTLSLHLFTPSSLFASVSIKISLFNKDTRPPLD